MPGTRRWLEFRAWMQLVLSHWRMKRLPGRSSPQSFRAAMIDRSWRVLMSCPKVVKIVSGNGVWKKKLSKKVPAPVWKASVDRSNGSVIHGSVFMMSVVLWKKSAPPAEV